MKQIQNDEIDLYELFETLWDGKWHITAFTMIAILIGTGFLFSKDKVYESNFTLSVNLVPPFYKNKKALADFKSKFYSINVFENWKKNNSKTLISFDDFSMTRMVDGFILKQEEDEQIAKFVLKKKGDSFIQVNTNKLVVLNEFFKYIKHLNELLKREYVLRANNELKIIETRLENPNLTDASIIGRLLSIDRFIFSIEKGEDIIAIQNPSFPRKVSPKSSIILLVSATLGMMMGLVFIMVRNGIRKRRSQLPKD